MFRNANKSEQAAWILLAFVYPWPQACWASSAAVSFTEQIPETSRSGTSARPSTFNRRLLDPFRREFVDWVIETERSGEPKTEFVEAGLPSSGEKLNVTAEDLLLQQMYTFGEVMVSPLPDNEWEKIAWVHDRIAKQLGAPLSHAHPRVRPETG